MSQVSEPTRSAAAKPLRAYDDLPGPRGLPLLGNALQIDTTRLHQQFEAWSQTYGPFFRVQIGPRRLLVVSDHEHVATLLRQRPEGFRRTTRLDEIWTELGLKTGVFGANGEVWKRQRRMVMAGFDPAHVRRYYPSMQAVARRLASRWDRAAAAGTPIPLQPDLMRYTVDTIAGLAFGAEVNTLESDADVIQNHLDQIFPVVYRRLYASLPTWRWWPSASDRRVVEAVREVNRAVNEFVRQARSRLDVEPDRRARPANLLEAMLVAADEPASGIDDDQVAGNVLTMLLAGEDTTANTLAWMLHLLWRHPEALARAVAEVRCEVADPLAPTLEELERLTFVEACAHETMRLKPVAPLLAFQAEADTTLGDVRVTAGMIVMPVMRHDSVSESHVPRAAAFDPDRWLEGGQGAQAVATSPKRVSMPFGAGPRICPGRYLALVEMKLAMATVLGHFDIDGVDAPGGGEAEERLEFTMAPVGLSLRVSARA